MITWINFLHLYQPPSQTKEVVDQVVRECYSLILDLLKKYPQLKLTLNISGSLVELLEKYGHSDVVEQFSHFAQIGRIEIVSTAMYHPILPLISEKEIAHQIDLHNSVWKKYLGDSYAVRGFFIPEMAYDPKIESVIKSKGIEWVLLDEVHSSKPIDPSIRYKLEKSGMTVVFRDHVFSRTFTPEFLFENKAKVKKYIITAQDGETYGHWHKDDKGFYKKTFTSPEIRMITASEYISELEQEQNIQPRSASWESLDEELQKKIPLALWNDPQNEIHQKMWKFAESVESILNENIKDTHAFIAQECFSKGLASCAWWWASGKTLGFSTPHCWNPTEIEKGMQFLLNAARSLVDLPESRRIEIEKEFSDLRLAVWEKHWTVYFNKNK